MQFWAPWVAIADGACHTVDLQLLWILAAMVPKTQFGVPGVARTVGACHHTTLLLLNLHVFGSAKDNRGDLLIAMKRLENRLPDYLLDFTALIRQ